MGKYTLNVDIHLFKAMLVSRKGETNETSETGYLVNLLIFRLLLKMSETE